MLELADTEETVEQAEGVNDGALQLTGVVTGATQSERKVQKCSPSHILRLCGLFYHFSELFQNDDKTIICN
jgi:hypothetical protein